MTGCRPEPVAGHGPDDRPDRESFWTKDLLETTWWNKRH
jgi:hypothetical protein